MCCRPIKPANFRPETVRTPEDLTTPLAAIVPQFFIGAVIFRLSILIPPYEKSFLPAT